MASQRDVRRIALALEGVSESPDDFRFFVNDKQFIWLWQERVDPNARPFWGRPFRVLFADRLVDALREAIADPALRVIDHQAGSVDSVSDSVDFLEQPSLFRAVGGLYDRA